MLYDFVSINVLYKGNRNIDITDFVNFKTDKGMTLEAR